MTEEPDLYQILNDVFALN